LLLVHRGRALKLQNVSSCRIESSKSRLPMHHAAPAIHRDKNIEED
jgi:hypothetical protein